MGFLTAVPDSARFFQLTCGPWKVAFEKAQPAPGNPAKNKESHFEAKSLVSALIERHVTPSTAQEIVDIHPADRVQAQLEVFDWLAARQDSRVSRNPAGFLISSIRGGYAPPKGFLTRGEREAREKKAGERKRNAEQRRRDLENKHQAQARARERAIEHFWESMSSIERQRSEKEALKEALGLQCDIVERGGALAATARKSILDAYALKMMQVGA